MEFHKLPIPPRPHLEEVVNALRTVFQQCPAGTRVPRQVDSRPIFGIGGSYYWRSLKQLAEEGVLTKIGGVGYVTGIPSKERMLALKEEHRRRSQDAIEKTRTKECRERVNASRALRSEVRERLLHAIIKEGIEHHVVSALRDRDVNHMVCCEKALRMVGCSFEQSPEAQEMLNKAVQPAIAQINFAFSIAEKPKAIEAEVVEIPD